MRLKSELYEVEQHEIFHKIVTSLNLDENKSFRLADIDDDVVKQRKILVLIPNIRKYFSFHKIPGAENPYNLKRPWLSILRSISKLLGYKWDIKEEQRQHKKSYRYTFKEN